MPLTSSCFWVMKVVSVIRAIRTSETIGSSSRIVWPLMNVAEIGAPKIVASAACVDQLLRHRSDRVLLLARRSCSTWKSAKKIGICKRIGRHDENGFVPFSR